MLLIFHRGLTKLSTVDGSIPNDKRAISNHTGYFVNTPGYNEQTLMCAKISYPYQGYFMHYRLKINDYVTIELAFASIPETVSSLALTALIGRARYLYSFDVRI